MVGAVVVRDGRVVGEGYHRAPGEPHAEVEALRAAGELATGATVYVNLEPCSHYGRTPPCAAALIEAGVARVVYACSDPNPKAAGGAAWLRREGVEVVGGVLEPEAARLNEAFLKHARTGLPFAIMKAGMSLDARLAGPCRRREVITSPESQTAAHRLRADCDAVLVGVGTVLADDPALDVRLCDGPFRQPLRVVVDTHARIPQEATLLRQPDGLVVAVGPSAPAERVDGLRSCGVRVDVLPESEGGIDLAALLRHLGDAGTLCVLVEGGARIHASMLRGGLIDRVVLFVAPVIAGAGGVPLSESLGARRVWDGVRLTDLRAEPCGPDLRIEAYVEGHDPSCSPD